MEARSECNVNHRTAPLNIILDVQNIESEEPVVKKLKPGTLGTSWEIIPTKKLSKRQQKRLLRREKWVANKAIRREKDREKLRKKKIEAKLNNIELGPSRKKLKECKMSSSNCKVSVAIDFSFDDLMNDKDLAKSLKQVNRCYSLNRRSTNPLQFYVTNFQGRAKDEMKRNVGYENWDASTKVYFHSENHLEVFGKDQIVYLTSESDNVVTKLEDGKVYIVGGLVDHNSHKGVCYETAIKQCIAHARLPIGEFMEMKHRKVLSIYHVFEILLNVCQGMSWAESLIKALPRRVGAVTKRAANTPTGCSTGQQAEEDERVNAIPAKYAANTPEQALTGGNTSQEAEDDEGVILLSAKSATSVPEQTPTGDNTGQEEEDDKGVNTSAAQVQDIIAR